MASQAEGHEFEPRIPLRENGQGGFLGRFCFTKDGIFCTRKGLRTYIFYPVKQLKIALTGMQNFAHLKQLPFDRQQVGVPGALIFAHLRVGDPGTERSIGVPDFQVRVVYRT